MIQVVQPNLTVVGTVGLCEKYTEDVFGVSTARHDADAIAGWEQDKGQHPGETPPIDVSVPLAFNWTGTIDGITKNWGHRCVWVKGFVYSSPLSGPGHLVFSSIPAIQKAFGLGAYLGFSEYIEDLRVIKEDDMTPSDVTNLFSSLTGGEAAPADLIARVTAKSGKDSLYAFITDPVVDAYLKDLRTWKADAVQLAKNAQYVPYTGPPLFLKKG